MDFSFSEEQQAIADLAAKILRDRAPHERLKEIETGGGPRYDADLWRELAKAGLVGIAVPEEHGGGGLGFLEVAVILEHVGRTAAPVPFLETVVLGALPLAAFGSDAHRREFLPRVASGDAVLTAALVEDRAEPDAPQTRAAPDGDGYRLDGEKICVPAAQLAERILVPAATGDGRVGIFLVDPRAGGVRLDPIATTSGEPEAHVVLDGVRCAKGDLLGDPAAGGRILAWLRERATAALSCVSLGVCEEALALTAEYVKTRKQFDQPIAMFQAVAHRAADAYVDLEAIRLSCWQAAWRVSEGLPAAPQVALAKFWAAEGGQRVVHAAQHLHGGIGVDRDYPLHRYFLYAKRLELTLGGATAQLREIGRHLATEPA